jgi:DNA repair exonuclease SbcCD ATPase subunit
MSKITLKQLRLKSFRSFAGQETIDFPENGLVRIWGESGAGKSNINLGITYALGYCPYPATELQSWLTDDKMQVELDFWVNQTPVTIARGEQSYLKIDNTITKGAKNIEIEFKKLMCMPIDLLEALTYRQQKTPGRFLSMTDSEKKEFLSQLLNLNIFEKAIDQANKNANESEAEYKKYETIFNTLNAQLTRPVQPIPVNIEPYIEKRKNLNDLNLVNLQELNELAFQVKLYQDSIFKIKQRTLTVLSEENPEILELRNKSKQCSDLISLEIKKDLEFKSNLQEEIDFKTRLIKDAEKEASKLSGVKVKLNNILTEITGIQSNQCPTCRQIWLNAQDRLQHLLKEKENYELFVKSATAALEAVERLSAEKDLLNKQLLTYKNQPLEQLREINQEILLKINQKLANQEIEKQKKINEFNVQKQLEIEKIEAQAKPLIDKYNSLKDTLNSLSQAINEVQLALQMTERENVFKLEQYKKDEQKYLKLREEVIKNENLFLNYKRQYQEELDLTSLFKTFLGKIFEEVLIEIANEINKIIQRIPNVSNVVVEFSTETVTQKGTAKQEIKPIITKNGHKVSLRSGLSGGQFTAVELAIDLAVGEVIGRRTGVKPAWFLGDEVFYGLGAEDANSCLELLKLNSQNRLIVIIDHNLRSDLFDKCINVVANGNGTSRIE